MKTPPGRSQDALHTRTNLGKPGWMAALDNAHVQMVEACLDQMKQLPVKIS